MRVLAGLLLLAACAPAPQRPDLTPISQGTGFITDDCIATGRPPEPATRAAYLDAAQDWITQPDVGPRFRPQQFTTLTTADCGVSWLVWNTSEAGGRHPRGTLYVQLSKGRLELLRLQTP